MLISDNSSRPGFLSGPHRGVKADIDIWRDHKPRDLQDGERGLADGAYQAQDTRDTLTCVYRGPRMHVLPLRLWLCCLCDWDFFLNGESCVCVFPLIVDAPNCTMQNALQAQGGLRRWKTTHRQADTQTGCVQRYVQFRCVDHPSST
jgi:hypothetical protein